MTQQRHACATSTSRPMPYPGFPTDMQPQISRGAVSAPTATSFDDRGHVRQPLQVHSPSCASMGADVHVDGCTAIIEGVEGLHGAASPRPATCARAPPWSLRACAPRARPRLTDIHYIERGYENFVGKLRGARGRHRVSSATAPSSARLSRLPNEHRTVCQRVERQLRPRVRRRDAYFDRRRHFRAAHPRGGSPRRMSRRRDLAGVLVTHEHSDHVKGLTVLLQARSRGGVCAAGGVRRAAQTAARADGLPSTRSRRASRFDIGAVRVTAFPHAA